jgi:hypothetical protein
MVSARYATRTAKALEVLLWLANAKPGIDIYHLVKAAFYADKYHLNKYGRPITGDDYVADRYGPLAQCLYGLLTDNPLEMIALGINGRLPFAIQSPWRVVPDRSANTRILSESDVEALSHGLHQVEGLTFEELVSMTHEEKAYIEANGGRMRFEDLLDDTDPEFSEKAADLAETSRFAIF